MTGFNYNFNGDKPDIRQPIPAGTPLFLQMTYTPGGVGPDGALTESKNTDAVYLKTEYTVLRGPYKGRKFFGNLTLAGGKLDEKGQSVAGGITRKTIRLMLDSANGLKSTDDSPEAAAKRDISAGGFKTLQGIRFVAKAKVEPEQNGYPAKNALGQVMTVGMKGYPSEAELDNPTVSSPAASPTPPPAWTAPAALVEANGTQTTTPASQAAGGAHAPAPTPKGNGALPAWAA